MGNTIRFDHLGIRWTVEAGCAEPFERWVRERWPLREGSGASKLQENRLRTAWRVDALGGLIIKEARGRSLGREWRMARELAALGAPVPEPVAWGEGGRASYFAAREVRPALTWRRFAIEILPALALGDRKRSIADLAAFIHRFQEQGIDPGDFHGDNVLVQGVGGAPRFYLVDLHAVRKAKLGWDGRWGHVATVLSSTGELPLADRFRLVHAYHAVSGSPGTVGEWGEFVNNRIWTIWHRHWASRDRKCLETSGSFVSERIDGWQALRRREFPAEAVSELIASARRAEEAGLGLKKKAPESAVAAGFRAPGMPGPLCVKRYTPMGPKKLSALAWRSRGRKAWLAANGLAARGIGAPDAWAMAERRTGPWAGTSYLILEDLSHGKELDRALCALSWSARPRVVRDGWLRAFGAWLRQTHLKGVRVGDAKTCNVMVLGVESATSRAPGRFAWIDLDGIRFGRTVPFAERVECLVQLNLSTPRFVTYTERLRAARAYAPFLPKKEFRKLVRAVARRSRGETILYVGPAGDVRENWAQRGGDGPGS